MLKNSAQQKMRSMHVARRLPIFLVAFLSLLGGIIAAAEARSARTGELDGKVFLVEKGEMGKIADGKDTYIFRDGEFRSRYYEMHYGFETGAYKSAKRGDDITFAVDLRSESHGTIHLEGRVKDDEIEVRYTWRDKGRTWFFAQPKPSVHWARSVTSWPTEDPGPPGGGSPSDLLDGKIFLVKSGELGSEASHHNDYLIFRDGLFVSTDCAELLDFRASTYSATRQGDAIRFQADSTSPTHGRMIWDGTMRDNVMDATARWIDKRWYWTIDRMYWFKGNLFE